MNFWKTFGASLLAFAVTSVVVIAIIVSIIFSMLLSLNFEIEDVRDESVLYINFAEDINDAPPTSTLGVLDPTSMTLSEPLTLMQVLSSIENAAQDDRIEGICIHCNGEGVVSTANIEEIRSALERFKASGKFVVAYDESYTQSEYYLATVADQVLVNPAGSVEWHGMSFTTLFYKGLFDKLDIKADIFRPTDCKFKSAVEPYFRTDMSKENRLQMETIVNSMWDDIVADVANSRGLSVEELKGYASKLEINSAKDALTRGMVDKLAYEDELYDLYDNYGVKRNEHGTHNHISLSEYIEYTSIAPLYASVGDDSSIDNEKKPLVAVIYAEGQIMDGNMYTDGYVFGSRLADELRQARYDDNTKAVVVRVNSPGGSALASEVAWREMELLQQTKPVVISMGDMAASGGYYISAPADYIFADKTTLTGSIGVFGAMFNIESTLKNKLGITTDSAMTSPSAGGITPFKSLTKEQRNSLSIGVDDVYTTFTEHVAEGRNLPIEDVLKIAEGRVWSGSDAVEIGLVDQIGGFTEAIMMATELADISNNYAIYEFRAPLTPFEKWLEDMGATATVSMGISDRSIYFNDVKKLLVDNPILITNGGIQALLPGEMKIEF
jgi:protease-4